MAKNYSKCALCGSKRFLNFAGLCKKCNRSKASSVISEDAMKKKEENLVAQIEREDLASKKLQKIEEKTLDTDAENEDEETEGGKKNKGTEGDVKKDK